MMRVLVFGGRSFGDTAEFGITAQERIARIAQRRFISETLDRLDPRPTLIVHGGATGADACAGDWARENEIACLRVPAQWKRFGKQAGPRRNSEIVKQIDLELAIGFPGGDGTADMARKLRGARPGLVVREVAPATKGT